MRLRRCILLPFACLLWARVEAQIETAPVVEHCRAADIELYQGGGDAGLGHGESIIELRNRSQRTCTMFGPPELLFFDEHGKRLSIPYGKNTDDYMFTVEPAHLVTLRPGDFAHFRVGSTSCSEESCPQFSRLDMVLPGDDVRLNLESFPKQTNINITAIRAGANTEDGWTPPVTSLPATSGALPGLSLRLDIPEHPVQGFSAHFTVRNERAAPEQLPLKNCVLDERLTNSAGATIAVSQNCSKWIGEVNSAGKLAPGALATMDLEIAGDGNDATQGEMCREGLWTADLTLVADAAKVHFHPVPFELQSTQCSDSEKPGITGAEAIHWTMIPRHGVRLGVVIRAKDNTEPAEGKFFTGTKEPAFRLDDPIELRLFLDNMTDDPVRLDVGPGAFRLLVQRAGANVPVDVIHPTQTETDGPAIEVTVPPHTQKELATKTLTETYNLPAGDYSLAVGPLRLTGSAAGANTPATGWPFTLDAATVGLLIKVLP
jgi:Protein of unknown function (DUF4232)